MNIENHHDQIVFINIEKTRKEILKDIVELEKFGWSISMIYDDKGYASHNHNSQFLNIVGLIGSFKKFNIVSLDNDIVGEAIENDYSIKRTVIRYYVKEN